MKNGKKLRLLTLSLVLGTSITAFAGSIGYRDVYITHLYNPNDVNYGKVTDSYVRATDYGSVYENHNISRGSRPQSFRAELEYRTIPVLPNKIMDTSYNVDGWNEAKDSKTDEEYRTVIHSWSDSGDYTEHLDYDMR